jgi:signal transduction histidine kinase/DNA-binding response OmpR family regulator
MMKQLKQFWAYIQYIVLSDELSFSVRTANMVCLVGVVSLAIATLLRIVLGAGMPIISIMLALVFTASFFLYLTYRYNLLGVVLWVLLIIICDVLLPISLFLIGGADSGVAAFCVMGTTTILLLTSGKQRVILVTTNVLLLVGSFLLAAYNPMWVEKFDPSTPIVQTIDNIESYLIATLFIGACIFFQSYMYSQEKANVERANAELEKERQVTFAFFDASPHVNVLFNDKLELIDCNPAALKIADGVTTKEEFIEQFPRLIAAATPMLQPDGRPSATLDIWLEKTINDGEVHFETAMELQGNLQHISVIMKRIPYENSFAIVAYLVDQTELYEARRSALESARAKTSFLANMSHEIRTPLNAVISMTSIGEAAAEIERKDYAFRQIGGAADHLLGVINDILDMSKIEADKFELNKSAFNLENMLHRVANVIGFRTGEKHQHFAVRIDENVPIGIIADEQRLAQIVTNLLSNSVKFTPEEGLIEVSVSQVEAQNGSSTLQFSVKDTGIGIDEEHIDRVFNSFEQAESNTTRKYGGTGLGLAISKRFVEMMGGKIWVTSELGKGSDFLFTVQVKTSNQVQTVTLDPEIACEGLRCLIVCSEEQSRKQGCEFAQRLGLTCDQVSNKSDAVALFAQHHYDICFLGWQIDGDNCYEFARYIKAESLVDRVVMSVYPYELAEIEPYDTVGIIDDYITRPLFLSDCKKLLNRLFGTVKADEIEQVLEDEDYSDCHLLLAEDVDLNKEIVYALLEPYGFSLDWAKDGREALEMFEANPENYDLILMDMQMPEMDGLEATRRIRELDFTKAQEIPIIALTANVFKEDIDRSLASGMNDHLGKPINLEELIDMLHRYLRKN